MWYAIVRNQQIGPLSAPAIAELLRVGAADGDTYVWSEDMSDWAPINEVTDLLVAMARPDSDPSAHGDDLEDEAATLMMPAEQAEAWAEVLNHLPDLAALNPAASRQAKGPPPVPPTPKPPAAPPPLPDEGPSTVAHSPVDAHDPGDSATVLEMPAAQLPPLQHDPQTAADPLPGLPAVSPEPEASLVAPQEWPDAGPVAPSAAEPPKRRSGMMALLILLPIVGAGSALGIMYLRSQNTDTPPVEARPDAAPVVEAPILGIVDGGAAVVANPSTANPPAANPEAAKADAGAEAPPAQADAGAETPPAKPDAGAKADPDAGQAVAANPPDAAEPPKPKTPGQGHLAGQNNGQKPPPGDPGGKTNPAGVNTGNEKPAVRKTPRSRKPPKAKDPPKPRDPPKAKNPPKPPKPADNRPAQLSRDMVQGVLSGAKGKLGACVEEGGPTGTLTVAVSIKRNGRLSSARVLTGKFKGTETGACVEKTVKGLKFPAFSGEPMHINLPLKL